MVNFLMLWLTRKGICSRCDRAVNKSEFKEDKYRKKQWNICIICQEQLKNSVHHPEMSWDGMKFYRNICPYCKSKRIRMKQADKFDNTGDIWKCYRCRNTFYGYQLEEMRDKWHPKKRPKSTKYKNVAQLKCWVCKRVFRQDNYKFIQSGRCPSCGFYGYELLRYVEPKQ